MKLWEKKTPSTEDVLKFTVGDDPSFDRLLAPYDVIGSLIHAIMLKEVALLSKDELKQVGSALVEYYPETLKPDFELKAGEEDIHSHLENYLVEEIGDTGKKIHTARSRNDQVMLAVILLMKEETRLIIKGIESLFDTIISTAETNKDILIPGYTHTQVAMPSSVALWLGAYAESLVNDLKLLNTALDLMDQNPLGSAAGFGTSFPIDRELSSELGGFKESMISSASAQLLRGKLESTLAFALSSLGTTLSRLSSDMIFYMSQELNIVSFPTELTTGSSIMPHKKNPDVLELIRAHCNIVGNLPGSLQSLSANMISGYHRDFQLIKELLFPAFGKIGRSMAMMKLMISNMEIRNDILKDEKYRYIFSVEELNKKVSYILNKAA